MADQRESGRQRKGRCPLCGKPRLQQWRPFCSKRCADIDLGRWLGEAYRVPVTEAADEDGEDGEDGEAPDAGRQPQ